MLVVWVLLRRFRVFSFTKGERKGENEDDINGFLGCGDDVYV